MIQITALYPVQCNVDEEKYVHVHLMIVVSAIVAAIAVVDYTGYSRVTCHRKKVHLFG